MQTQNNLQEKTKEELINMVNSLVDCVDVYTSKLQQRDTFIKTLEQALALSKQRHYGRGSEKNLSGAIQGNLFDEVVIPTNTAEITTADETITVPGYQRKKPGRKPLPKDLPRVQQIHDLPEDQKTCHCGCQLSKIGQEKSEQLEIIPAKVRVIEHIKLKYACKACEETIKTASMPKQPIPKSIASPGLLAHVLVAKFKDHLPLYRQENIFQRMGVDIARNTLAHWVIKSSDVLLPLYQLLQSNIIDHDIAYADETRVQVLKEAGRAPESQSYMWCFLGGSADKRSIIYHYDPGRAHTVIEDILNNFSGYLHCDGFSAYDCYAVDHDVKLAGCWMHARRRFAQIVKMTKSEGLAHKAVAMIATLYRIEKYMKSQGYNTKQIYQHRKKQAKPLLDKFKQWLDTNQSTVLPKSPIGQAINYCLNQWDKLTRYLEDGRLEIDNGASERAIKPFVIGRKNWLFSHSVAGVKAAQVIYSLMQTCQAHNIEPYAYLRHVLTHLPNFSTQSEQQALLPFNIDKKLLLS